MAYAMSGNVSINVSANATVAAGAQVLAPYTIPISATPIQSANYSDGAGAGLFHKALVFTGTLASASASAAIAGANLSTGLGVDGTVVAFTSVREFIIFNDGLAAGFTTADTSVLTLDTTFANAFGVGAAGVGPLETGSKIDIPAGSCHRFAKPFGPAGWTVGATNVVALATPAANAGTIAYRIIVFGN